MNPAALQKQLGEPNRELRYSAAAIEKRRIGRRAEIDRLQIERTALVKFSESKYPEFPAEFDRRGNETRFEADPEFD